MTKFALMLPTLNAEADLPQLLPSIQMQTRQPDKVIVIDSASDDRTAEICKGAGAEVHIIPRVDFNHGGTRMKGLELARGHGADIVIFMTQDAILHSEDAFEQIIRVFEDDNVASAYGRQLPHIGAGAIEAYSRIFSYDGTSTKRSKADISEVGFRTAFCSNAFSAFRTEALLEVGGFPRHTIFGEDALAVAELILAGHSHCYVAEARVRHSHSYSFAQEFKRYFDVGVMHAHHKSLIRNFGSPSGAGFAFVLNELKYLVRTAPWRIPEAIFRTGLKFTAYKMGQKENHLSVSWKRRLSMHKRFWAEG